MTRSQPREPLNNNTNEPVVATAAVAGSGSRPDVSVPKAPVGLSGVSLVCRSVLATCDRNVGHVVATVPEGCLSIFETALPGLNGIICITDGTEHQDSVRLGLSVLPECSGPETIVLIHDTVYPLVPPQIVTTILRVVACDAEAVMLVAAVHDSIRQVGDDGSRIVDRSTLRIIQAPQETRLGLLRGTHEHVARHRLATTDDASVVETLGHCAVLVFGHHDALKITEQLDPALAQGILDDGSRI